MSDANDLKELKGSKALESINKLVDEIIDDNDRLSKLDFDKDLPAQLEAKKEANKMMEKFKEQLASIINKKELLQRKRRV